MLAEDAEEARAVVVEYLKNDTAYGQPYEISEVRRHDVPEPHVLVFNWGEWDDYPPKHDSPGPR